MSSTLTTHLYKKPSNGDRGSTFFDDLNANTDRIDAHTHDGVDSAPIPAKNLTHGTNTIANASWAAVSGQAGTYKQTVTLPSGYVMGSITMNFLVNSGSESGCPIYPSIVWLSSTTYDIYINDNTIDVKAVYA